jgi:hypothetical protein
MPYFNRPHIALQPLAFIIAIGDHGLRRPTTTSHDHAYPRHFALPSLTPAPNVSLIRRSDIPHAVLDLPGFGKDLIGQALVTSFRPCSGV